MAASNIKSMLLYSNATRTEAGQRHHEVYDSLAAAGYPPSSEAIPAGTIASFTCLNYTGASGASRAASRLRLGEGEKTCLDLGSGLGGPAIVFANETNAKVIGIGEAMKATRQATTTTT